MSTGLQHPLPERELPRGGFPQDHRIHRALVRGRGERSLTRYAAHEKWKFKAGTEVVSGRTVLDKLGGGKSYEVYLAWDDHLCFTLVMKLLRPHLVEDEKALRSLRREAEALERLSHPLIVRAFGAVTDGERPHIVLEHLEGPHLASLLKEHGPLPLEQLIPLATNLCSAIAYMEAERMVHLDVKPRNIVIGLPPRLIDLSVARTFERAAKIKGHVGTDAYMAPEQCDPESKGPIGAPADVWGIGATMYHAIAGHVPFPRPKGYDRDDPAQRYPQLTQGPTPLPERTHRPLSDLVMSCLEANPNERPTARELSSELEPLLAGLPRRRVLGRFKPKLTG